MPRYLVLFATLKDELDALPPIGRDILRRDFLGCTINYDIRYRQEVVKSAPDGQSSRAHGRRAVGSGTEQAIAPFCGYMQAPVGGDIAHTRQYHVILTRHSFGNTFADDPISIDGDTCFG